MCPSYRYRLRIDHEPRLVRGHQGSCMDIRAMAGSLTVAVARDCTLSSVTSLSPTVWQSVAMLRLLDFIESNLGDSVSCVRERFLKLAT